MMSHIKPDGFAVRLYFVGDIRIEDVWQIETNMGMRQFLFQKVSVDSAGVKGFADFT